MSLIIWTQNFLNAQGKQVTDNIVYQDNQSAILLENNGRSSSGRRTHHLNIRYFFITDRIGQKEVWIEYCPTKDMLADFFTKPLQGSLFRWMQAQIMNIPVSIPLPITTQLSDIPKECVGTTRWADVVKGGLVCPLTVKSWKALNLTIIGKCTTYSHISRGSKGLLKAASDRAKGSLRIASSQALWTRNSHNFYQI